MSRAVSIATVTGVLALVLGADEGDPYPTPLGHPEITAAIDENPYIDPAAYLEFLQLGTEWLVTDQAHFAPAPVTSGGGGGACTTDSDCDDGLACTDDICVSEMCTHPIIDETDCNGNGVADSCEIETRIGATAAGACQDAESIAPGIVYFGSTFGPASEAAGCTEGDSAGIWYRYSPASDGLMKILLRVHAPLPKLAIYSGCPATANDLVACSSLALGGRAFRLSVRSEVDYWIRISGPVTGAAAYSLYMTGPDEDGAVHDCNGNSVPDECDLDSDRSNDCNENATPDECEPLAGLYGVGDGLQKLVTLDEGTGRVTSITPLERTTDGAIVRGIQDIEWSPDGRTLYAVEAGYGRRAILTIDQGTGDILTSVRHDPGVLRGLEFDANGRLLGIFGESRSAPSKLAVVDPGTGRITVIGPTGLGAIGGLAFDSGFENLYSITLADRPPKLVSIDPATGTATVVGELSVPVWFSLTVGPGLAFDAQGRLLTVGSHGVLHEIDPTTAQTTAIGPTRFPRLIGLASVAVEPDCNGNGEFDLCDLYLGVASDCNDNDIPDECEPIGDCNVNDVTDICDIASEASADCNFDSVPDECQPDCNENGVPDSCDLSYRLATSADCNDNLEPDECDIAGGLSLDCNGDGVPDECESDCNGNGVADECDVAAGTSSDENGSGIPDECERTIFVDAQATGRDTGVRWRDAYTDLQTALADAAVATTPVTLIWVAAATYVPGETREDTFLLANNVRIYGGFTGVETRLDQRDPRVNRTVLSGDIDGDDGTDSDCCAVHFSPGCDDEACSAAVCRNSQFSSCCESDWLLRCAERARSVWDCRFLCRPGPSSHVVTATNVDNTAVLDGFVITGGDAGTTNSGDGGGGGMLIDSGSPVVANCTFVGNFGSNGGALQIVSNSHPKLTGCAFLGNHGGGGGAVNLGQDSVSVFINSVFSGNYAEELGGAIFDNSAAVTFTNCTITQNEARYVGGGTFVTRGTFNNCIVWGNVQSNGNVDGVSSQIGCCGADVSYTLFIPFSLIGGTGNIDVDPMFVDADGEDDIPGTEDDDLRLRAGSPAIDAGASNADANAHLRGFQALPETDLAGNARIADDVDTPDTGVGGAPIVDMGAFEFFPDCNGNGVHDSIDVAKDGDCNANAIPDDCDLETGASPDCNATGVPDECDIASGTSADVNENGIPDECNCVSNSGCDDGDVCTFDALCDEVVCANTTARRGDLVGRGNACGPDGRIDLQDILAVLDVFTGRATTPCLPHAMDIAPCTPDGIIDILDILAVLDGFQGVDACCGN